MSAEVASKGLALLADTINKLVTIAIMRPDLLDKILGPKQAELDITIAALKDPPEPK